MRWFVLWCLVLGVGGSHAAAQDVPRWPDTLPRDEAGFTVVPEKAGARTIYVAADGDDRNDGLTPDTPMASPRRAAWKVRHYSSDRLLLKAGDTFDGGLGVWNRSGNDPEHPVLIGVYGEGDRPVVRTHGEGFITLEAARIKNLVIQGIHAVAVRRDPDRPEFDAAKVPYSEGGVRLLSTGGNILFEDCKIESYALNFLIQVPKDRTPVTGVTLRRCIVVDAWSHWDGAIGSHSQGIYADRAADLRFEQCLFDHNGWNATASGGNRTKFNHNLYIQDNCRGISVVDNFIARSSAHGLQLRPGGEAIGNLFYRCPMAMFTTAGTIVDNVVLEAIDMSEKKGEGRGQGLYVLRAANQEPVQVRRNVVGRQLGRAYWMGGIELDHPHRGQPPAQAYLSENVVFGWKQEPVRGGEHALGGHDTRVLDDAPAVPIDQLPGRLEAARERPRGVWQPKHDVRCFNTAVREAVGIDSD
jgi:hypothetical protein